MAANNRSTVTAVHFSLMFFVMLSIFLGVAWYLAFRDLGEAQDTASKLETEKNNLKQSNTQYVTQIGALKDVIGHQYEEVGEAGNQQNANTVLGAAFAEIRKLGGTFADQSYSATLQNLRTQIDQLERDLGQKQASLNDTQDTVVSLKSRYQSEVDVRETAKTTAERELAGEKQRYEELIEDKEAELKARRQEITELALQLERIREEYENLQKRLSSRIANLETINDRLREELNQVKQVSFERPDGVVRKVDHNVGLVWISLGSADYLPVRASFSVYTKAHHGVGRGEEDIKGSIEVTRIVDDHLAEARILEENPSTPISSGDPIYTPLWSPGRREKFAIIGLIDFDGDGLDDRKELHSLIRRAGATIQTEVDDTGKRTGGKIDVHTKFLIVGEIPDPTTAITPKDQEAWEEIARKHKELMDEAREQGVRVVSLGSFLEWIGWSPRRRLWRPGMEGKWLLKAGGASPTIIDSAYQQNFEASSGQTSKVYGENRRFRRQKSSSGTTARTFRGGGGGY